MQLFASYQLREKNRYEGEDDFLWLPTSFSKWCTLGGEGPHACPSTSGTQLVYAGGAVGSHYTHRGGGANYLCLPEQPQYSTYTAGAQSLRAHLYGAEYETGLINAGTIGPLSAVNDHNVPCAVCYTST